MLGDFNCVFLQQIKTKILLASLSLERCTACRLLWAHVILKGSPLQLQLCGAEEIRVYAERYPVGEGDACDGLRALVQPLGIPYAEMRLLQLRGVPANQ